VSCCGPSPSEVAVYYILCYVASLSLAIALAKVMLENLELSLRIWALELSLRIQERFNR
jgi:hypothetical protein